MLSPDQSSFDQAISDGPPPLHPRSPITYRQGANLPHWRLDNAMYAVTFRLGDSLPQTVLNKFRDERTRSIQEIETLQRPLTEIERNRINYIFSDRVDAWLDRGHGSCIFHNAAAAQIVRNAMLFHNDTVYHHLAWCIMPNHVHTVVHIFPGHDISDILRQWKGCAAREINKLYKTTGTPLWQKEPYDHIIRDHVDLARQVRYVLNNPAAAKLKNWPWLGGSCYHP